jgi:hypothetical protein
MTVQGRWYDMQWYDILICGALGFIAIGVIGFALPDKQLPEPVAKIEENK